MDGVRRVYSFFWSIENCSYNPCAIGAALVSPRFTCDGLEGTDWYLRFYMREENGFTSLELFRREEDDGPEYFGIKFEISILAEDGTALSSGDSYQSFKKGRAHKLKRMWKMDESLYHRNFPRDILTVRCRMYRGEGKIQRVAPVCFRYRFRVETISFEHVVQNFSTFLPNTINVTRKPSKNVCLVKSSLYFTYDSCPDGEMIVEITPSKNSYFLCKRRISLLGRNDIILSKEDDNRFEVERRNIQTLPLSFTRQKILSKENLYLPGDKLTLLCECSFSTGQILKQIDEVECEMPPEFADEDLKKNVCSALRETSTYNSVLEDIKDIYIDKCITDVKLKTRTKSFPAHKLVLCARSPVFKRMLTIDMRERNTDCIEVDDLEDDVVEQLLLFLYSDLVKDLEWGMATRLYYAADKYEIGRLKAFCSTFLVSHLSCNNAGELLLLADTHSDADLKGVVDDFILEHEEDVYGSDEWEMLMETHPELVAKAMHLKYKRKNKFKKQ